MSRWRSIVLVAQREILERGRSRGFILSVAFTTLLVVGSFVLPTVLFADDGDIDLGIVQPAPPGLDVSLAASAKAFDATVAPTPYPDRASGEAALKDGKIEALLEVPADLSGPGEIIVKDRPDDRIQAIASSAVVNLRQSSLLTDAGVPPADFVAASQPPEPVSLDPQTEADTSRFVFANVGIILIFIGIFSFGFAVLTGVVEEKQSRVVEVVLSTVRPRDLLMGKVFGIGVLGLIQLAVFIVAGLAAAILTDRFELPSTTPTAVVMLVVWFLLGYGLYATALGFLGALASRMEEASNASTPVTLIATLSYVVALVAVTDDPSGVVATVMTFLPPSAPMVVPLRVALDAIPAWQVFVSIALTVAAIWALFAIGGRVYSGAVLQTGGRIKLRDAWRAAGE